MTFDLYSYRSVNKATISGDNTQVKSNPSRRSLFSFHFTWKTYSKIKLVMPAMDERYETSLQLRSPSQLWCLSRRRWMVRCCPANIFLYYWKKNLKPGMWNGRLFLNPSVVGMIFLTQLQWKVAASSVFQIRVSLITALSNENWVKKAQRRKIVGLYLVPAPIQLATSIFLTLTLAGFSTRVKSYPSPAKLIKPSLSFLVRLTYTHHNEIGYVVSYFYTTYVLVSFDL